MLGFLALIFLYLFLLLARKTEKPARSSLVKSLILAGLVLMMLSMFSLVAFGVLFLFLFFMPFFFFPAHRSKTQFHFRYKDDPFKDFFERVEKEQAREQQSGRRQPAGSRGMSVFDAANLLGVPVDASEKEIKSAYRKLMLKHHPDKGGAAEHATKLNIARDIMIEHARRHG